VTTGRASVSRCVVCQAPGRPASRRCADCQEPVHQRCQAAHACAPKRARMAVLEAAARARLLTYRVILTLHVDQALDSPASWDWPSRLGLRPPEGVVAHVERRREETGETGEPVRPPS
jgi:hypothetical protein